MMGRVLFALTFADGALHTVLYSIIGELFALVVTMLACIVI